MRILVISDVHGNREALEAVAAEPHDAVICLGDLVGYGPDPAACLRWARSRRAVIVMGNHERALVRNVPPGCRESYRWLAEATAALTASRVTPDMLRHLDAMPHWAYFDLGGRRHLCVHAAPSNPLYRYVDPEPAAWEEELAGLDADVLLVGHTHVQFQLVCGRTRVVNPGSVGLPKDGDPRAAYAVIENGTITLKRVPYPVERTVARLRSSGLPAPAVDALANALRTGGALELSGPGAASDGAARGARPPMDLRTDVGR